MSGIPVQGHLSDYAFQSGIFLFHGKEGGTEKFWKGNRAGKVRNL